MSSSSKNLNKNAKSKKKALVRWVGGKDHGQYHVIDFTWLLGFDQETWRATDEQSTTVAEWRVGKREQWKAYDCKVIDINESEAALKKRQAALEAEEKEKENESGNEIENCSEEEKSESESEAISKSAAAIKKAKNDSARKSMQLLEEENRKLKDALAASVLKTSDVTNQDKGSAESQENNKVPLFPQSKYKVDAVALSAAISSGNRATFVGDMLLQLFPRKVLVVSNIKGGKPKGQGAGLHRWALDHNKMVDLRGALNHHLPGAKVSQAMFNTWITRKINYLRLKLKKKELLSKLEEEGCEAMANFPHAFTEEDSDQEP